jgi:hypothetical protein
MALLPSPASNLSNSGTCKHLGAEWLPSGLVQRLRQLTNLGVLEQE